MPCRPWLKDEEWDDDDRDDDDDEGDVDDGDRDDDDGLAPCPHCGEEILEDSERCPNCEQYLSREDKPWAPKPWWVILGVMAALYAVLRWTVWH